MNSQQPNSVLPRKEFQGRRPSPLKICRDSHKIRKPASAVAVPAIPSMAPIIKRSELPVIVYMRSPKIIHTEVQDFKALVQRLTGSSSFSDTRSDIMKNENLTAGNDSTVQKTSTATTSYQPAASVDNMGMSAYNVFTTSHDFANPSSQLPTMIDRSQDIGSSASEPEAPEARWNLQGPSAVTSASSVATTSMFSPLSPNFLFSSPHLNFSPTIFQDLPLMTPNSDQLFYSPTHF